MPIKFNLKKYHNKIFIESGTYMGLACIQAVEAGFEEIHSMEIHKPNLDKATNNLKPYEDKAHISLYHGDSTHLLPTILKTLNEKATFWLDGHGGYQGTGAGRKNCPLNEELDAIAKHHIKNHTIMIDDLRMIRGKGSYGTKPKGSVFPWGTRGVSEESIMARLRNINPKYQFTYEMGFEAGDCLVAYIIS